MEALDRQVFGAGKIIFREGDEGAAAYLIERGSVEISKFGRDGSVPIGRLGERGIFGEMALIDDGPRMATATALEETVCVVIAQEEIQSRLRKLDPFMTAVLCMLVENVRHQTDLRLNGLTVST
jgi:CRP-like cAMP-binding protein